MKSTPTADIVLESDTTRVVDSLDVVSADVSESDQSIRVDPNDSTVTLYGRTGDQRPTVGVEAADGTSVATFEYDGTTTTRLELAERGGDQTVTATSENGAGTLTVSRDDTVRTTLGSVRDDRNRGGGLVSVHDEEGTKRVVARADPAGPERSSGVLEVGNADGNVTGRLVGADAALELTGARDGAGEVVLVGGSQAEGDDVYVHVTGATPEESMVAADNRPRVRLDGRNARLELGRRELGPNREPVAGRVDVLTGINGTAEPLLSLHTGNAGNTRFGRVTFHRRDGGSRTRSGAIEASDGLVFNDAMRVDEQGGVHANGPFAQNLEPGGPILWTDAPVAAVGETVELELTLGDGGSATVEIRHGSEYELLAPIEATGSASGEPDARVHLQFHTNRAGDPSSQTLTVDGDAVVDADDQYYDETAPSGSISPGRYECLVEGPNGATERQMTLE